MSRPNQVFGNPNKRFLAYWNKSGRYINAGYGYRSGCLKYHHQFHSSRGPLKSFRFAPRNCYCIRSQPSFRRNQSGHYSKTWSRFHIGYRSNRRSNR